jgi:molecular chaperone GrpE
MAKHNDDDNLKDDDQTQDDASGSVSEDLQALQGKIGELENQLKRAVADYHNLEKRVAEGRSELTSWAATELIQKILPSIDHLEVVTELGRSQLAEKEESREWFRGVEMAVKQLKEVLKGEGLDEIVADGQFDPSLHEAVDTASGKDGEIIKVAQRGYTLNGKVIRPAKVVVGRKES